MKNDDELFPLEKTQAFAEDVASKISDGGGVQYMATNLANMKNASERFFEIGVDETMHQREFLSGLLVQARKDGNQMAFDLAAYAIIGFDAAISAMLKEETIRAAVAKFGDESGSSVCAVEIGYGGESLGKLPPEPSSN